VLVRATGCNLD